DVEHVQLVDPPTDRRAPYGSAFHTPEHYRTDVRITTPTERKFDHARAGARPTDTDVCQRATRGVGCVTAPAVNRKPAAGTWGRPIDAAPRRQPANSSPPVVKRTQRACRERPTATAIAVNSTGTASTTRMPGPSPCRRVSRELSAI